MGKLKNLKIRKLLWDLIWVQDSGVSVLCYIGSGIFSGYIWRVQRFWRV